MVTIAPRKHDGQSICLEILCCPTYSFTMTWSGRSSNSPWPKSFSPSKFAHIGNGPR